MSKIVTFHPNTLSETKICNLHPKARRRASPFLLYGSLHPPLPFTPRQRWTPYQFHLGCWRVRGHVSYPAVYSINLFSYCLTCSLRVLLSEPNHPVVQNYVILCIRGRQGYRICEEAGETRWTAGWSQAIPYVWHLFHGYNTRCSDLLRPPFAKTALIPR